MTRPLADVVSWTRRGRRWSCPAPTPSVAAARLRLPALLASEQVGVAQWCLETTVAYLKQRRQFGRVVGGFQALKHRLADLYVQVESGAARPPGTPRRRLAAGDADLAVAAAVAQAYCAEVAVHAAEEASSCTAASG